MNDPLLLTATEAATRLGVSRDTLRRLARTRGLPTVSIGKEVRYPWAGLVAWVADQAQVAAGPHPGVPHDPQARAIVRAGQRASVVQVCRLCGQELTDLG